MRFFIGLTTETILKQFYSLSYLFGMLPNPQVMGIVEFWVCEIAFNLQAGTELFFQYAYYQLFAEVLLQ